VRAEKEQKQTAVDLGIHPVTLSKWLRQDDIDNGRRPAGSRRSPQSCVQRVGGSASWKPSWRSSARPPSSSARTSRPQRLYPVIDRLVDAGAPVDRCCRILGVARQNHYKHKRTPTTPRQLRREWLTGLIREVHVASRVCVPIITSEQVTAVTASIARRGRMVTRAAPSHLPDRCSSLRRPAPAAHE
jgi:transposase-like protein